MITLFEIEKIILKAIPGAKVAIRDMTGTNDHFEILVVSNVFQGKTLMEQHRIVFKALDEEMRDRIHAVKIKTRSS